MAVKKTVFLVVVNLKNMDHGQKSSVHTFSAFRWMVQPKGYRVAEEQDTTSLFYYIYYREREKEEERTIYFQSLNTNTKQKLENNLQMPQADQGGDLHNHQPSKPGPHQGDIHVLHPQSYQEGHQKMVSTFQMLCRNSKPVRLYGRLRSSVFPLKQRMTH